MIPDFPKFESLHLKHYKIIKSITDSYPPYADFNFACLWSYDIFEKILISKINGNLIVRASDYITRKTFLSFFGHHKFIDTCNKLLAYCIENNIETKLKLVPGEFASENTSSPKFKFKEDRDNFDYILLLKNLSELNGSPYRSKRSSFKRFCRNNPDHLVKIVDIKNHQVKKDIFELFDLWQKIKNKDKNHIESELKALNKLINEAHFINFITTAIYLNNKLLAFSINEKVNHEYGLAHFGKTNPTYSGITEALYKYTSDELIKNDCKYWNVECDMGDEKLRQAKLLWRPYTFLKKYDISFA